MRNKFKADVLPYIVGTVVVVGILILCLWSFRCFTIALATMATQETIAKETARMIAAADDNALMWTDDSTDIQEVELLNMEKDAWDTPLRYKGQLTTELLHVWVASAGRDKKFGTKDDIIGEARDFNEARIIGKWAGKKFRQAKEGLAEGIKEGNLFDSDRERKKR